MGTLTLGLDLGPNSIGWALIDESSGDGDTSRLIDMGVRVFPEGVDAFDTAKESSRSESRRVARGMRRQVARRARRKRLLRKFLESVGLWPTDPAHQKAMLDQDPYELRSKALDEPLSPHQIGRVLLHLNARRGFLSNRKHDRGDSEVAGMLKEIGELESAIKRSGHRTLGEYLHAKGRAFQHAMRSEDDHVRRRHTLRRMLHEEFDAIWRAQAIHHPTLTADLRWGKTGQSTFPIKPRALAAGSNALEAYGLEGIIFFQRRLYWPRSVIGACELERRLKRAPCADRHVDRFRVLQEVNNLRYADPDTEEECALDDSQRQLVLDFLATHDRATFDQIRKKLGFLESVKFNLERGKRSSIKGMTTDCVLAKAVGKEWHERPEDEKDAVVRMLINVEGDEEAAALRLQREFGFSQEEADSLLSIDLPPGYSALSITAIDKLLPHLERGLVYQSASDPEKSAIHAAGYLRRDELRRYLFDELPSLRKGAPGTGKLGDLPNPVVRRALVELRKVVNAVIREYGKPAAVHVEMARSLQMGPKARSDYNSRIREREGFRDAAASAIRDLGHAVRREGILRYLLWQEQGNECVYCGKSISQEQLFRDGETDIDHILPYSRCLDDSQMNKVVCHRRCNHDKGQRTPYEWLAATDHEAFARICQHAGSLMRKGKIPYAKYRRFLQKELDLDSFIARQLTDTAYITRATLEYLKLLFERDHAVLGLKGQLTAELRWQWGLDTILEELPDSPAWRDDDGPNKGAKNRADHRHHAIDALVVALTNRKRLRRLSDLVRRGGARAHGEILDDPWPNFRQTIVDRVQTVLVSHRVERKVSGALHEETLYGATPVAGEWVVRKSVDSLSPAEVDRIRDGAIKRIVLRTLAAAGIQGGRGSKPDARKMKAALSDLKMASGVPIKKVRLTKPELTIQALRDDSTSDQRNQSQPVTR